MRQIINDYNLINLLTLLRSRKHYIACYYGTFLHHLVEFILQHTGVQAQLSEAVLLHRLNDAVHLCIVLRGQVGEVDVRGDELSAQHACVQVAQDLLCITAQKTRCRCVDEARC